MKSKHPFPIIPRLSQPTRIGALSNNIGKLPPQATDIEELVLGALMLEKDALDKVADTLSPESFYKESNQAIYQAILGLFDNQQPIDIKTVVHQLKKTSLLEMAGGAYYISQLASKVNSSANIEYHAAIISEQAIKRSLISISSNIQKNAYEDTTDAFELLDYAEQQLFDISEKNIKRNYSKISDLSEKAVADIRAKMDNKDGLTGVPSGFSTLDRITSGWQPSDLVIIAARPGMGKTTFVTSVLRNAAVDFNEPVAIFSLEMSNAQLVNRIIASESELNGEKIKMGNLEEFEWEQIVHTTRSLFKAPMFIDDTPALSIREFRTKSRRLVSQYNVRLLIVDYLQLMCGETVGRNNMNREQEIASISRSLKNLAKELDIPIIALSQLSRSVETRGGDKRPVLADLRESGSIEQDADMVIFLYRPEYYDMDFDETGQSNKNLCELIIAKNRNGRTDSVRLKFIGEYTKFSDWDEQKIIGEGNADQEGPYSFPESSSSKTGIIKPSKASDNGSKTAPF